MGIVNPPRGVPNSDNEGVGQVKELNALTTLLAEFNGSIDATNVKPAFAKDNVEPAFSTYRTLVDRQGFVAAGLGAGTYVLSYGTSNTVPGAATAEAVFYLDPADYAAASRATKYRLKGVLVTNAVAPATNWTFGLYPVTGFGGASGASPTIASVGPVVAGSTFAFNAPGGSNGGAQNSSGDFTAPAAGFYILGVANSGLVAANSSVMLRGTLQMRQV